MEVHKELNIVKPESPNTQEQKTNNVSSWNFRFASSDFILNFYKPGSTLKQESLKIFFINKHYNT